MVAMKTITPGHEYELASFEGGAPQTIRFINKKTATTDEDLERVRIEAETRARKTGYLPEGAVLQEGQNAKNAARGKLVTVHDGTTNEEVLAVLIDRMNYLQCRCQCRENAIVITKLEESLMWLNKRTAERKARNVEGTSHA